MLLQFIKYLSFGIIAQASEIDPGFAINSLRQNNAVVGILYFIVIVESAVIIKLWTMINNLQKERIEDLKTRLKAEEELRKEIHEVYTKLNIDNNHKKR